MIRLFAFTVCLTVASPVWSQDHSSHSEHAEHQAPPVEQEVDHCATGHLPPEQCPPQEKPAGPHAGHAMAADKSADDAAAEEDLPARALEGPDHAADLYWDNDAMADARANLASEHGTMTTGQVMLERLESRVGNGEDGYLWDISAFYGGDINKFVLKSEGEGAFGESIEDAEIQALFDRAVTPFFDLQAGVRLDVEPETRSHLVVGLEGLAPYMFHIDAALFLSDRGDLTARIEAEYDQKLTQQLILQPRIEIGASAQDIPEREIGAGLTKIEPGLRLRYEFVPEFAPYIGVQYEAKLGETADLARASGEDADSFKFLMGLRTWF